MKYTFKKSLLVLTIFGCVGTQSVRAGAGSLDPAFDLLVAGTGLVGSAATVLFASTYYSLKYSHPNLVKINGTLALGTGAGSLKCLHYGFRNDSFPRLLLWTIGRTPKKKEKKKFDFDSEK